MTLDQQVRHVDQADNVVVQWSRGQGNWGAQLNDYRAGSATVSRMDQAAASQPELRPQLGDGAPMGIAGAPRNMPEGTAGNYPGQGTGPAPRPADPRHAGTHVDGASRPWGDRDMPRATHPPAGSNPPGSEYTSTVPGSWR